MWGNVGYFIFLLLVTLTLIESANGNQSVGVPRQKPKNITAAPTEGHRVFISYRRTSSRHLAMLLKLLLEKNNVWAFLDVEDLRGGFWDNQLMDALHNARNFVIVLSVGTLDRSLGDTNYNDYLHKEIREAVHSNSTRIIPVFDLFDYPSPHLFSPEIQTVLNTSGVTWNNALLDESVQKLLDYLQV